MNLEYQLTCERFLSLHQVFYTFFFFYTYSYHKYTLYNNLQKYLVLCHHMIYIDMCTT